MPGAGVASKAHPPERMSADGTGKHYQLGWTPEQVLIILRRFLGP